MRPERANTAAVEFYTPDELAALLSVADDTMRPLLAIAVLQFKAKPRIQKLSGPAWLLLEINRDFFERQWWDDG